MPVAAPVDAGPDAAALLAETERLCAEVRARADALAEVGLADVLR